MTKQDIPNPFAEVKPVVVVHFDGNGDINYLNTVGSTLLIIDERAPSDRVYMYGHNSSAEEIAALIGDSPVGHSGDGHLSENQIQSIHALFWKRDGNELSVIDGGKA